MVTFFDDEGMAIVEGYEARQEGVSRDDAPEGKLRRAWLLGWDTADRDEKKADAE